MSARMYAIADEAQPAADTAAVLTVPATLTEEPSMVTPETASPVADVSTLSAHTPATDDATPAALPEVLAETVITHTRAERARKHKRSGGEPVVALMTGPTTAADAAVPASDAADHTEVVESALPVEAITTLSPVDDPNNPDWKSFWPTNELVMYAMLDPSTVQAPTIDGVRLIRTQAQITEMDPETSDIGIVAKVPVQILPMARGYEPLYNEVTRARRLKQRVRPYMVEMRGVCKRLNDQDKRFAQARRTSLFGMQIGTVKRIDTEHVQFGRWRGRGTVVAVRPFDFDNVDYYRVTLEVLSAKQKAHLRGQSAQVDPVDVVIRKDHPQVQRFRRVGQRLLVEAEITAHTSIMRDTHPALEGLDDVMRERLATIRQGIVLANMGEFPDAQAEQEFENWLRHSQNAGTPGRPGRGRRPDGVVTSQNRTTSRGTNGKQSRAGQSANGRSQQRVEEPVATE